MKKRVRLVGGLLAVGLAVAFVWRMFGASTSAKKPITTADGLSTAVAGSVSAGAAYVATEGTALYDSFAAKAKAAAIAAYNWSPLGMLLNGATPAASTQTPPDYGTSENP